MRGWFSEGRSISEDEAERISAEMDIPFCRPNPSMRGLVFLIRTWLSGVEFAEDAPGIIRNLERYDPLKLVRIPSNTHDSNAISVRASDVHIGYIPRRDNQILARLMDSGQDLMCLVKETGEDGRSICVSVFLWVICPTAVRHFDVGYGCEIQDVPVRKCDMISDDSKTDSFCIWRREFNEIQKWHLRWGYSPNGMIDKFTMSFEDGRFYIGSNIAYITVFVVEIGPDGENIVRYDSENVRCDDENIRYILDDLFDRILSPALIPAESFPCGIDGNLLFGL